MTAIWYSVPFSICSDSMHSLAVQVYRFTSTFACFIFVLFFSIFFSEMSSRPFCEQCNVLCDTERMLENHKKGKKHRAKCLSLTSNAFECNDLEIALPRVTTPDNSVLNNAFSGLDPSSNDFPSVPQNFHCATCNISLNSAQQYEAHITGQKHLKKVKSAASSSSISTGELPASDQSPSASLMVFVHFKFSCGRLISLISSILRHWFCNSPKRMYGLYPK